jgi:hypothetical protein
MMFGNRFETLSGTLPDIFDLNEDKSMLLGNSTESDSAHGRQKPHKSQKKIYILSYSIRREKY